MGVYNYYNRFIKNYSQIVASLTKLQYKDTVLEWGFLQQSAFEELMHALTSTPVLQMPRFDKQFTVHVDSSDIAIGAVHMQKVDDIDMPVCYYSKRLNETKACQSFYERELYAIVQALSKC